MPIWPSCFELAAAIQERILVIRRMKIPGAGSGLALAIAVYIGVRALVLYTAFDQVAILAYEFLLATVGKLLASGVVPPVMSATRAPILVL